MICDVNNSVQELLETNVVGIILGLVVKLILLTAHLHW